MIISVGRIRESPRIALTAALALLLVACAVAWSFSRDEKRLGRGPFTAPQGGPDQVERSAGLLPPQCGLTGADLKSLVGKGAKKSPTALCGWKGARGGPWRELTIGPPEKLGREKAFPAVATTGDLSAFGPNRPRLVAGLGDMAMAHYEVDSEAGLARVLLHIRDIPFQVTYLAETGTEKSAEQKKTMDGALRAASSLARAMDALAAPKLADPVEAVLKPARMPKMCPTVSAGTLERTVGGPATGTPAGSGELPGLPELSNTGCQWRVKTDEGERALIVSVYASPEREKGSGTATAARAFRMQHRGLRGDPAAGPSAPLAQNFRPITGLGEQSLAAYELDKGNGLVCFQIRNMMVVVRYSGLNRNDDAPAGNRLPADQAVNGAYTAAQDIARAL